MNGRAAPLRLNQFGVRGRLGDDAEFASDPYTVDSYTESRKSETTTNPSQILFRIARICLKFISC